MKGIRGRASTCSGFCVPNIETACCSTDPQALLMGEGRGERG